MNEWMNEWMILEHEKYIVYLVKKKSVCERYVSP